MLEETLEGQKERDKDTRLLQKVSEVIVFVVLIGCVVYFREISDFLLTTIQAVKS